MQFTFGFECNVGAKASQYEKTYEQKQKIDDAGLDIERTIPAKRRADTAVTEGELERQAPFGQWVPDSLQKNSQTIGPAHSV